MNIHEASMATVSVTEAKREIERHGHCFADFISDMWDISDIPLIDPATNEIIYANLEKLVDQLGGISGEDILCWLGY